MSDLIEELKHRDMSKKLDLSGFLALQRRILTAYEIYVKGNPDLYPEPEQYEGDWLEDLTCFDGYGGP